MSLLYRAIWQDQVAGLLDRVPAAFRDWIAEKTGGRLVVPEHGEAAIDGCDVRVMRVDDARGVVASWILHEDDGRQRWNTTLLVFHEEAEASGWIWVDVENVSTDYVSSVDVVAPRLVARLLAGSPGAHRGSLRLTATEHKLGPHEIASFVTMLADPGRDLPLVVFSPVPGMALADPNPRRHRYFLADQFGAHPRTAGLRISRYLSPFIARQRAPAAYVRLRDLIRAPAAEQADDDLWHELDRLTQENKDLEGRYLDAAAEVEVLNEQLRTARGDYLRLWTTLEGLHLSGRVQDAFQGTPSPDADWRLLAPARFADLRSLSEQHLELVRFPVGACQELGRLDQADEARSWAQTAWLGLVALNLYARVAGERAGGFWEWCQRSGDMFAWPASTKKLAMSESETVMHGDQLRRAREFPVDPGVGGKQRMVMEAHLKISEGGGPLAPRLYFHDDTKGSTGRIHVGFLGPHDLVPNTRTS